jgi:hypothetical protein
MKHLFGHLFGPSIYWITSGRIKNVNINRMIQLTEESLIKKNLTKKEKNQGSVKPRFIATVPGHSAADK